MSIKVGDRPPGGTLNEFIEVEKEGCPSQRQEDRDLWFARRFQPDLFRQACS